MSVESLLESKSNCVVPQQLSNKNSHKRNTSAEQSVSSNYILDKFLEDDKEKGKKKKLNGSVGILQRSLSLKSLRGGREEDSSFSAGGTTRKNRLNELNHHHLSNRQLDDEEDNFSVLSLDRRTYDGNKRRLQRKSHYASEVHLPAHVLAQFEAKSLFADLKRDSFRARSGTSNFALNPIFDEVVFAPPSPSSPTERDQVPPDFNSTSDKVTVNYESGVIVSEKDNTKKGANFPIGGDESVSTSSSSWNYLDNFTGQEGENNCVEFSFESLVSSKKSKFQLKDFSDELY